MIIGLKRYINGQAEHHKTEDFKSELEPYDVFLSPDVLSEVINVGVACVGVLSLLFFLHALWSRQIIAVIVCFVMNLYLVGATVNFNDSRTLN
jgi:hypothetical protein